MTHINKAVLALLLFIQAASTFLPAAISSENQEKNKTIIFSCDPDEHYCEAENKCIPKRWLCDGDFDCNDNSDEDVKLCEKRQCGKNEFRCSNGKGQCIPLVWKCDNHPDCSDASDEENCDRSVVCPEEDGKFLCKNGMCTQKSWVCDGQNDCGDNSDEDMCQDSSHTCQDGHMVCHKSRICVSTAWVCDGDLDCPNGEDEMDCSSRSNITETQTQTSKTGNSCPKNEFQCKEKHFCIHDAWICDGDKDCPDGSDEIESLCDDRKMFCSGQEWACAAGGQCVTRQQRCDGIVDCVDASDELDCQESKCDTVTQFECGNKNCINITAVCDGVNDCGDWQDEPEHLCGQDECKINNGGCQQECVDTSDGFFCKCQPGYKLVSNTTCQDIDECETPGTCSQMCINRPGTFKCDCLPGYEKEPTDHTRCKATHGDRRLIFAQKTDIRMIWLDLQMTVPVVAKTRSSCALDFHYHQKKIFYTDIITQKIYSVNFDGSNQTELLSDMIVTPDGLAVDWVYQRLYWTDTGTNSISSININGDTGTLINIVKERIWYLIVFSHKMNTLKILLKTSPRGIFLVVPAWFWI